MNKHFTSHFRSVRRTHRRSCAAPAALPAFAEPSPAHWKASPFSLGLASYTFRNFTRAQMIGFMKQLNVTDLNCKDVKDHLPMDPARGGQGARRLRRCRHQASRCRDHLFPKMKTTISAQSSNTASAPASRSSSPAIPAPATLPRIEKFVKEYDIRFAIHNHGPEDKIWPSPLDVLKAVKNMDPRMGCCIDVGHGVRAGTDVVEAIHAVGPRLFNMHMKDLTSFHSKESQVAVGDGNMPIREIFEALIAINTRALSIWSTRSTATIRCPASSRASPICAGVLGRDGFIRKWERGPEGWRGDPEDVVPRNPGPQ